MSNVSIFEKNWTDLVFEDRNKAYGAYVLRQENPRTTLIAFISGVLLLLSLIGGWLLLSSFGDKNAVITEDEGIIIKLSKYPNVEPEKEKALPLIKRKEEKETKKIDKKDLIDPKIVKHDDNPDDVRTNTEIKENPTNTSSEGTAGTTGTVTTTTGSTTGSAEGKTPGKSPEEIVRSNELDRLPEYGSGMKQFYQDVADNIDRSELNESTASLNVIMSFVIEKDGSMTDIKVLRSSDKALEKQAIRALKALRIKWKPGYLNGEKVRTLFTLPIRVAF